VRHGASVRPSRPGDSPSDGPRFASTDGGHLRAPNSWYGCCGDFEESAGRPQLSSQGGAGALSDQ
jgi:hypothetical protein